MGKSSSGKDSIYRLLMEDKALGLKKIISYTTRPIREGEQEGVEYHFTDHKTSEEYERKGKIIEMRCYQTIYGEWRYFLVEDEQIDLEKRDHLLIGTLESYEKIRAYFGEERVCPLYVEVEDGVRLSRALEREKQQKEPKYEEMCRRFLADAKDFSEERLEEAGIEKRFINEDLVTTVEAIKEYISQQR